MLTDVSSEMVYPLMPLFLTEVLGASAGVLGIVEGIAESLASFMRIGGGALSDRWGKRKPLAAGGYGASVAGKVLLCVATAWPMFLAGRIVDRFGKGIRNPPRDALIAEVYPKEMLGRAFGFHRVMDTTGAAVGVLVSYFLFTRWVPHSAAEAQAPFRVLFIASIVPAALALVAILMVKEQSGAAAQTTNRPTLRHAVRDFRSLPGELKAFLAIAAVFTLGNSSNQFLLLRAKSLGHSDATVILLYLTYNLVYAAASYPAGRLSDRIGRRHLLVGGYALFGLVYLAFGWVSSPGIAWVLFVVYGAYMGMTEGVEKALIAQLAPKDRKATVLGLHATIVGLGLLPASIIAGQLWQRVDPGAPFILGGVLGLIAAIGLAIRLRGK